MSRPRAGYIWRMARALWSGSLSFGLVNIPVKAFSASRDHAVHFHQLERKTGARIRYEKVSDKSGNEVASDDIELGYELANGDHVTVDPDEIDALRPRTTRTVDIADFVSLDEIDPIYYTKTYWLAPDGESAERAYRLLLGAMEEQRRVGIGSVVIRRKQYLAALRPLDGALAMSTMRFADEVIDKATIDSIPTRRSKLDPKELKLASNIIDSLATDWDPKRYKDTYTDEVRHLIEQRAKGKKIAVEEPAAQADNVIDLMQALEASVAAAKRGRTRGGDVTKEMEKAAKGLLQEVEASEDRGDDATSAAGGAASGKAGSGKPASKKAAAKRSSTEKASSKKKASKKASTKKASTKKASTGKRASKRSSTKRSAA
jgi:DNA end-binding protein Ku